MKWVTFAPMEALFEKYFGVAPEHVLQLTGSGSNRRYCRMWNGDLKAIGVEGSDVEENKAFIEFARHFREVGLSVPEVYAVSEDLGKYLQEDLGAESLFENLSDRDLVRRTVAALPHIQVEGARGLDFSLCHPVKKFDERSVMFDLNYFKYCFLKPSGVEFNEVLLQDDFEAYAADLLAVPSEYFMYRDFQSRNVMVKDRKPYFIDFQGGRVGPLQYDLASFAWQAKANFPDDFRQELVDIYLDELSSLIPVDREVFKKQLTLFVLFRTLQVLGAYGFRGLVEKKLHFIDSIPYALKNLGSILPSLPAGSYPYLVKILSDLAATAEKPKEDPGRLVVDVCSFSFRRGVPEDHSGNGGGYVFDCRGMNNPGRYEEYKSLTGLDQPVIDFLEEKGEITQFLSDIYDLVDRHVDCYVSRGFSHLSVAFGCTGGQHRSVYSAQHTAEHLKAKYGDQIIVHLVHRERGLDTIL